jgi:ATP-dependent Clp protease ATP-binding subunit ClpB
MTSNLGSQIIMELGEDNRDAMKKQVNELLHRQFKPEFLNRIDEIIIFHGLSREDLAQIVEIQVRLLVDRLAVQNISLNLSDNCRKFLVREGYSPAFGARPLRRVIQRYVQDGLAMKILEGSIQEGDDITVDVKPGSDIFDFIKN